MVSRTRRALLQGAAALTIGLAGCSGASSSSRHVSNEPFDAEHIVADPDSVSLRSPDNTRVAWRADEADPTTAESTEDRSRITDAEEGLIADEETAAHLRVADVDGAPAARSFVAETDFDSETLLLRTSRIRECYRLQLCGLTWSSTEFHTYFGRVLRPADVACRTDAWDRVSHLIRIPAVLDPAVVRSRGSGTSGGGCADFQRRYEEARDR